MKIQLALVAGLLAGATPHAAEAAWRPLSKEAIETATFKGWQAAVRERDAVAATARSNDTGPSVQPAGEIARAAEAASAASATGSQPASPIALASAQTQSVAVTGEPGLEIATPHNSTDLPDEAGLETVDEQKRPDPFLIRLQILLDRAHASPGAIDGFDGENTRKAIAAYEAMRGLPEDGEVDPDLWVILSLDQGQATRLYTISQADVDARFVDLIPDDYGEMAKLDWLGYKSPAEMLAERFHMDEDLLLAMNPAADLMTVGTQILVADVGEVPTVKVARIVVDKQRGELIAYDAEDNVVLMNPATIGSDETPSPSGHLMVTAVAENPTYSYNPAKNFTQGNNTGVLTIPAGPNGPVGSTWIALSKPTFGIHGTPHPTRIDKSRSHGCVRLTNWDVEALAHLVQPAVTTVEFRDAAAPQVAVK